MTDELNKLLSKTGEKMEQAIDHLENELAKIRAGKATPQMLDSVMVDYYGTSTPLAQVGNINTPDAKTLVIQPWEKNMLQPIEKAITVANLGFNPQNDGTVVRINLPPLTEERRKQLVKMTKDVAENAKVTIRSIRKDTNDSIKKLVKDGLPEDEGKVAEVKVQDLTNKYTERVDEVLKVKEKEIMTV